MDLDAIFRLIERAEQSAFSKIEVQQGDLKIVLERGAIAQLHRRNWANPSVASSNA